MKIWPWMSLLVCTVLTRGKNCSFTAALISELAPADTRRSFSHQLQLCKTHQ